jgi:hypothetical protein
LLLLFPEALVNGAYESLLCCVGRYGRWVPTERLKGRESSKVKTQALRSHHPGKPAGFRRLFGSGDFWITKYTIVYLGQPSCTVSITGFKSGEVVYETQ